MKNSTISITPGNGDDLRSQFGALCWRIVSKQVQVLLITSRDTGRWVIPKGWPINGLTPALSAAREAFEEAGVKGQPEEDCLGLYTYDKMLDKGPARADGPLGAVPCMVAVYPLRVTQLLDRFPEAGQRRRKWFACAKAAQRVDEPELQRLLAGFDPGSLSQPGA